MGINIRVTLGNGLDKDLPQEDSHGEKDQTRIVPSPATTALRSTDSWRIYSTHLPTQTKILTQLNISQKLFLEFCARFSRASSFLQSRMAWKCGWQAGA